MFSNGTFGDRQPRQSPKLLTSSNTGQVTRGVFLAYGLMGLEHDKAAAKPRVTLEEAINEAQETLDRFYPADWDYYEDVVANNPPNGEVTVPHKVTGDLVMVDLLTMTSDEIVRQCGIPDHMREESLLAYRLFIKARLHYWDQGCLPETIPLLKDDIP